LVNKKLVVEPNVLKAPAVEDAVHHHPQASDPVLPANWQTEGDRRSAEPGPPAISCRFPIPAACASPGQPLWIAGRSVLQIGIAIAGVVTLRAARVVLIELCIRVIGSDPVRLRTMPIPRGVTAEHAMIGAPVISARERHPKFGARGLPYSVVRVASPLTSS